ncbi:MAG: hypothetical protein K2K79_06830 [Paramuribaculum sp.]|nr:hypothetical protein [Paramuribaculum sp.]
MQKILTRLLPAVVLLGATLLSCSDDDNSKTKTYEQPTHRVTVDALQRTAATFTIEAPQAADYAYVVQEKDEAPVTDAEELFKTGTVGLLEEGKASVTTHDIEGAKEYVVYSAVRRINPYVYSDVVATDLSTDLPYTDIVTLDKVGLTDVAYHIEMPDGATKVKHILVKKADYIAIKNIIGSLGEINEQLYLKVFGFTAEETGDFQFDKIVEYDFDAHSILHTGTTYYLMAGVVGDDGEIDPDSFELIEFDTRKPAEAPYNIDVAVTTTSTQAIVSVIPDPEIVEYRLLVAERAEFDYALAEGEAQMRNLIVGLWDDEQNSPQRVHTGTIEYKSLGLIPNSEYVVGIVGYDKDRREKLIRFDFVTGEPTGPKPTLTITEVEPSVAAPWSTKAFNVKATNTTEVRYGFFIKSQIDQLLYNGSTLANVVRANGNGCSPSVLQQMLSDEGVIFETSDLQPQTEYMFAVYARNDEYVTAVEYEVFTTEETPLVGGAVRKNMPGKYIASTTIDEDGTVATFPVTIATGYDALSTGMYKDQNRLVCFGFGPESEYPFVSPTDLINGGMSSDDAYAKYGPKWFIEFVSDTEIRVPNPTSGSNQWVMGYDSDKGKNIMMYGYGISARNGREFNRAETFPVEVSDDGRTITIKGSYLEAQLLYYYPTMVIPGSGWMSPAVELFRCYSELVLTKQESATTASSRPAPMVAPRVVSGKVGTNLMKSQREGIASKLK